MQRRKGWAVAATLAIGALAVTGAGCGDDESDAEKTANEAQQQIEDAANQAEKKANQAANAAQDQAEELEKQAKEATESIGY